jgi:hypothetical protein
MREGVEQGGSLPVCLSICVQRAALKAPPPSLTPYSITAQGPSAFFKDLYGEAPAMVMQTLEDQASTIGKSLPYLLSTLRINAPAFVEIVSQNIYGKKKMKSN